MKSPNIFKESFKEDFLHHIWKFQYFNKQDIRTRQEEAVCVLFPGHPNSDAGPDFKEAKIIVGGIEWHGHVEIHYKSQEWNAHRHATDPAYNNVILHVVWEYNGASLRSDGSEVPVIELKGRVDQSLIETYRSLVKSTLSIPCAPFVKQMDTIHIFSMLERTLVERMEAKSKEILQIYQATKNDWEETAYRWLGKCYGFKVNSDAFLKLCEVLPFALLKRYRPNPLQFEALLFGCAGFLEAGSKETYPQSLRKEFHYLVQKHASLRTLMLSEWKFLRLRPANFPTLRIAQFSAFLQSTPYVFDSIFHSPSIQAFADQCAQPTSPFWQDHYHFGAPAAKKRNSTQLGKSSAENLLLNALLPLRFAYADFNGLWELKDKTIEAFRSLKAEENAILHLFHEVSFPLASAYEGQALLQLHHQYCKRKRCLDCHIGAHILYPL